MKWAQWKGGGLLTRVPWARIEAGSVDEADFAALRAHLEDEDRVRKTNDRPSAIRSSRAFHMLLARIARNGVLEQYLSELTMRTSLIIGLYGSNRASLCDDDEHQKIVESVVNRDEITAQKRVDLHLRHIESEVDFSKERPRGGPLSVLLQSTES